MARSIDWSTAAWHKSSHSGDGGCVEVAFVGDAIGVRDTKDRSGAVLEFTTTEWSAFVTGVRGGEFNK